jgi:rhodanese-related sulfurtransferase
MPKTVAEMIAEAKAQIESVSPKDAAAEAAAGNVVLLDVREPVEWEHHIAGAVQVPRGLVEFVAERAEHAVRQDRQGLHV